MKNLRLLLLLIITVFILTGSESFAYPRYRIYKVYRYSPRRHVTLVTTYCVVKKPKIHHKHHKRIIRKVIYY